jgi:hypothetical protein
MNAIYKITTAILLIIGLSPSRSTAQFVPGKYELGINAGTLVYQGDLSESILGYTRSIKPAIGINASEALDDYFSLRANLVRGAISADESTYANPAYRRERNFKFSSSVTELSAELVWDLFGKTYTEGFRRLSPYFFAGAGLTLLNVKRDWSHFNRAYFNAQSTASLGLAIDSAHKPPGLIVVLPVGAGLRYLLTNHIYLNLEATYRITASDYIDGFKYSADPDKNDHYYGVTLGASYRLGHNLTSCPKVNY